LPRRSRGQAAKAGQDPGGEAENCHKDMERFNYSLSPIVAICIRDNDTLRLVGNSETIVDARRIMIFSDQGKNLTNLFSVVYSDGLFGEIDPTAV
jgi:hypothetical protein